MANKMNAERAALQKVSVPMLNHIDVPPETLPQISD